MFSTYDINQTVGGVRVGLWCIYVVVVVVGITHNSSPNHTTQRIWDYVGLRHWFSL